ncbi:hypothetical protein J6590_105401 [Homalodisca vitripennis]|nr:hypothetical protein J6590_105401 [Homalodisca vitripennis]
MLPRGSPSTATTSSQCKPFNASPNTTTSWESKTPLLDLAVVTVVYDRRSYTQQSATLRSFK